MRELSWLLIPIFSFLIGINKRLKLQSIDFQTTFPIPAIELRSSRFAPIKN
jgi:hypothetical protein